MEVSPKMRLLDYLKIKHLSLSKFSEICGIEKSVVSRISEATSQSTLSKIEKATDLNIQWLIYGEGNMLREATPAPASPADDTRINRLVDTIATLQEVINDKTATIEALRLHIAQLEAKLNTK